MYGESLTSSGVRRGRRRVFPRRLRPDSQSGKTLNDHWGNKADRLILPHFFAPFGPA